MAGLTQCLSRVDDPACRAGAQAVHQQYRRPAAGGRDPVHLQQVAVGSLHRVHLHRVASGADQLRLRQQAGQPGQTAHRTGQPTIAGQDSPVRHPTEQDSPRQQDRTVRSDTPQQRDRTVRSDTPRDRTVRLDIPRQQGRKGSLRTGQMFVNISFLWEEVCKQRLVIRMERFVSDEVRIG